MDPLADFLDGPRARGAFLLRSVLSPPWSLRIVDEAPLTVVAMVGGEAWLVPDAGPTTLLREGDVALLRGPDHYTVADEPDRAPTVVIHPGQRCTTVDGVEVPPPDWFGVRTWGNSAQGETTMLTGTYQSTGDIGGRLLSALPAVVVLPSWAWQSPLVALLAREIQRDEPGQEAVLDRLLDVLMVDVLRGWFARPEANAPSWYRAHGDPVVGPALRLMHDQPDQPWTVATLAATIGISRAGLARRFNELVGKPPMRYLAEWRLSLAADLLREPGATVGAVADRVGYGSAFALSAAFKRVRGVSPQQHRTGGASAA
jgi:AraC-like DNA-binding protein